MTVAELIEKLRTMPQDALVVVETGIGFISPPDMAVRTLPPNCLGLENDLPYGGQVLAIDSGE